MSMSQEEIEALMNGLDIADEPEETPAAPELVEEVDNTEISMDEIDQLIAETNNSAEPDDVEEVKEIEEEISEAPLEIEESTSNILENDDIDALLNEIELDSTQAEEIKEDSIDDSLVNIDGIVETKEEATPVNNDDLVKDWTDSKINEGVFPLPAESDTKVVSQLSQVANDSEEKVGQIFDVLSLTLDNNNDIRSRLSKYEEFLASEIKLLNSLNTKFPNVDIFNSHLSQAQDVSSNMKELAVNLGEEDMQIFEAMELMQFNDINRQKIERVMSVIRKLSAYLNNLFEDDGSSSEVAVAKHIHGDDNSELMNDEDLDKLIAEFDK
jgi:hypothetical protein